MIGFNNQEWAQLSVSGAKGQKDKRGYRMTSQHAYQVQGREYTVGMHVQVALEKKHV